jgi:GAF domain-containing protein/HAMP domain-containing protein
MEERDWVADATEAAGASEMDRLKAGQTDSLQAPRQWQMARHPQGAQRRKRRDIRDLPIFYKLLLSIVAVVLLALGVTTYVNVTSIEGQLSAEIGDNFGTLATTQMNHIADILSEQVAVLQGIAVNDYIRIGAVTANARYSGDSEAIETQLVALDQQWLMADEDSTFVQSVLDPKSNSLTLQLENYAEAFPNHVEIFVTDRYGGLLASTNRTSDYYQADEAWWQAAYNDGKGALYISQPEYDESAGLIALVIAAPIMSVSEARGDVSSGEAAALMEEAGPSESGDIAEDRDGYQANHGQHVIGIARTTFNIDVIYRAVGSRRFGKTGGATLVDAQGRMIAGPNPVRIGRSIYPDWIEYARSHKNQSWHRAVDENDVPLLLGYAYLSEAEIPYATAADVIHDLDWLMFIYKSQAEAYAPVATARRTGILAAGIFGLLAAVLALVIARMVVDPLTHLVEASRSVAAGNLSVRAEVRRGDEMGELAEGFNSMADEIAGMVGTLEQRVAMRTAELEQRTRYLEASAGVSRAVASILDVDDLIRQVVEIIRDRFKLYYVGLFLVDETHTWAVLRAGTGEAGRAMLARGHRIKIGEGMIGWSAANARPRVALEAGEDAVRLATAELPDTRSEAALPLRSRDQVLGAITVQSSHLNAFDEDTITVLQSMADQVAVALDNARLLAESQEALDRLNRLYGETIREGWAEVFSTRPNLGYSVNVDGRVQTITSEWRPLMLQAFQQRQSVLKEIGGLTNLQDSSDASDEPSDGRQRRAAGSHEPDGAVVAVPVAVQDQVLGVMEFRKESQDGVIESEVWTSEEISLLETLCEQLGLALERARLYQDTRSSAARTRLVAEISARIRETLDLDAILQTAVREIGEALNMAEVEIRMGYGEHREEQPEPVDDTVSHANHDWHDTTSDWED